MAVDTSDIVFKLSVSAAAGNTTGGTPATSLGDQVSTTVITSATLQNLFRTITGPEAESGITLYRCLFVCNEDASATLENAEVVITSQTAGGGTITIASDNIAASAKGSASAQAAAIVSETSAPSGVSAFGAGPLSIGNIPPLSVKGVWLKMVVAPGAGPLSLDNIVLTVNGETLA